MTTVSADHSTSGRRRLHPVAGTVAAAVVAAAAVTVGTHFIGVTPPGSDTSPSCAGAYECQQPGTDGLLPRAVDPFVVAGTAAWNSAMPSGPVASPDTGGAI